MDLKTIKFITSRKDWIKIWEFHFSFWFLERILDMHLKFPKRLGNENRNTINIFSNNSESAFFLEKEINRLKTVRKKKVLSRKYVKNHYKNSYSTINKLNQFLKSKLRSDNVKSEKILLYIQYSNLFEELLSYYRASRPEIFEIVEEILKKNKVTSKEKKYYKSLILKYGKLRFDLKKAWLRAEQKAKKFKISLAKSLKLNLNELEYLTLEEIKTLTAVKNVKKYKALVNQRKFCTFGIIKGKKVLITNKKVISVIKNKLEPKIDNLKEIYGKMAHKGLVKGRVKVIPQLNYKKMITRAKLFKNGEILVTGMTQPDIVFACQKAKAIITDEGGITSHAAIVSRELGIPCIIGTKIATKVLKDGDLVEVDANKGIVKILKKK